MPSGAYGLGTHCAVTLRREKLRLVLMQTFLLEARTHLTEEDLLLSTPRVAVFVFSDSVPVQSAICERRYDSKRQQKHAT